MRIETFIEMDKNGSIEDFVFDSLKYITTEVGTELNKKYMHNRYIVTGKQIGRASCRERV